MAKALLILFSVLLISSVCAVDTFCILRPDGTYWCFEEIICDNEGYVYDYNSHECCPPSNPFWTGTGCLCTQKYGVGGSVSIPDFTKKVSDNIYTRQSECGIFTQGSCSSPSGYIRETKCEGQNYYECEEESPWIYKFVEKGNVVGKCGYLGVKTAYYRFDGSKCSFIELYQDQKTDKDYLSLADCEKNIVPICTPICNNKQCGDDGCGGSCGDCGSTGLNCVENQCIKPPVPPVEIPIDLIIFGGLIVIIVGGGIYFKFFKKDENI